MKKEGFGSCFYAKEGFTLTELLVVVLIIGILAAVALPQYQLAVAKSRYNTLKDLTNSIVQAEELYYWEHGTYSKDFAQLDLGMPSGNVNTAGTQTYLIYSWGSCFLGISNTDTYVRCADARVNMTYLFYLHQHPMPSFRGRRACIAADKDLEAMQSKICQQETGKQEASATSEGRYMWYY